MGIYVGNGWIVHSSRYGTTLTPMTGWYETSFAWGRSPLVEAGLEYWAVAEGRRTIPTRHQIGTFALGIAAALAVVTLAFSSGGYFPSDHGLLAFAFALVAFVAVLVLDDLAIDRRSVVLVGGLVGFALWQLLSILWSPTATWPVLEAERTLIYVVAGASLVLVVTRERVVPLVAGIVAGVSVVAVYALATRLFPGRIGGPYDPSAGYQLAEPIGYWNALGLLLAMGLLLALGLALEGTRPARGVVGALLVPISVALYFTFSRGALVALAVGVIVFLVLRSRALASLVVTVAAPGVAVLLASRATALTRSGEPLAAAQDQGSRLAIAVVVLSAVGAAAALAQPRLAARATLRWSSGRRLALVSCFLVLGALVAVSTIRAGGPASVVTSGLDAFTADAPSDTGALDRRLLSVSGHGRADYWRVAVRMVGRDPLLGAGGGGFERRWMQERPAAHNARDAHNIYLETLAELGPVGLSLLLVVLAVPLLAVREARSSPLGPAAAAAFVAFLVHAAVDWDWELPLLVLTALACGVALVAMARTREPIRLTAMRRALLVAPLVCVLAVALVANVGNRAVAEAAAALERGDTVHAESAAERARTWAPWSHEPWELLGEAQLAAREDAAARHSLREAIRRAPEEWRLWFDLAIVSRGPRRAEAITRARELNPLSDEIRETGYR
jgi:O-antigen ligase